MAPKRKKVAPRVNPVVKSAEKVKKKYKKPTTPRKDKIARTRRALYDVTVKKVTIRKAAIEHDLSYSFLHRRVSGETSIDSRNGPSTVFTSQEEREMAEYLSEMAKRGMGLRPGEFLDFIQDIVQKDGRKTPFSDNRPSYEWYKKFMERNNDIIGLRREVLLEASRSKLSSQRLDKWYSNFRDFLVEKDLIDKPERIWNADETGFQMGSKAGYVIGPSRESFPAQVPHMSGSSTKARLTVLFSASASGSMMPPFYVYPDPAPKGVNPLSCSLPGGSVHYTEKGWMNSKTFEKYLDEFEKHIVTEKPVVLLIDSVGSHINRTIFTKAKSKGIEMYRIVPNATHLMQPLDKGVFGPMKNQWYKTVRKHNRENPGVTINKLNFAEKLKDCYNEFYKPSTVVNSFVSSGIYPVNRNVISDEQLKTNLTFEADMASISNEVDLTRHTPVKTDVNEAVFNAYTSVLSTPVKQKYEDRQHENYDIQGVSPGYDTYVLLKSKINAKDTSDVHTPKSSQPQNSTQNLDLNQKENNALQLLADVATGLIQDKDGLTSASVSPVLKESLKLPKVTTNKVKRKSALDELPDNLTSPECIRKLESKSLDKVRKFAEKEKKAKLLYLKRKSSVKPSSVNPSVKGNSAVNSSKGKGIVKSTKGKRLAQKKKEQNIEVNVINEDEAVCVICEMTWIEDQTLLLGNTWIQCDVCNAWVHEDCLPIGFVYDKTNDTFVCHKCTKDN